MHHSGTGSHHMPTTSPAPASTPTRTTHQLSRSIHTTPWPRRARQAGKQKPAILAAAKTTGDGTSTDTTVKKKRVQRKTAADGDVAPPKARKAARPIKRTNADEMFLQLLPEDGIEQLQHQLKDEMHALVERKGGKMMASGTSKKSVEVGAANAPPDVASDEPPTTSGQATGYVLACVMCCSMLYDGLQHVVTSTGCLVLTQLKAMITPQMPHHVGMHSRYARLMMTE